MTASPLLVLFVLLGAALVLGLVRLTRVTDRDVEWLAASSPVHGAEAAVYRRYLTRHRQHRIVGGSVGALLAVVVGVQNYSSVQLIGAGEVSPFADVFFCAVAGTALGTLSAETYRLAEPRGTVQVASLVLRTPVALPRVVPGARVLAGVALAWGAGVLAVTGEAAPLGVAVVGGLLAVVTEATRAAVAGRRRPVRTPQAVRVDARIRGFAGRSVSWLQLAAAVLVAAWVVSLTPTRWPWLEWVQIVLVLGGLVAAVVLLRRASPRPGRRPVVEVA